ncbi:DUF3466 family protein [Rhizobacter fulvus]
MSNPFNARAAALATALVCISACASAQSYQFHDLNIFGGTHSSASAINNLGQIVGRASFGPDASTLSTLWDSATAGHAIVSPLTFNVADINDLGQMAGSALAVPADGNDGWRAALLDKSGLTLFQGLQPFPRGTSGVGINNKGQVVGNVSMPLAFQYDPTRYTNHVAIFSVGNAPVDLAPVGGNNSYASAINNLGQVVGRATSSGDFGGVMPTVWSNGTKTQLAGWNVLDINDKGQIVGSSFRDITQPFWDPTYIQLATLFEPNGDVVLLETTDDQYRMSLAKAVNESGVAVGYSSQDGLRTTRGMLWVDGKSIDLNVYLDANLKNGGWYINDAVDINEAGDIVGTMVNDASRQQHAFLLSVSAVPEPSTYALLLAGGTFGAWRLRRRQS